MQPTGQPMPPGSYPPYDPNSQTTVRSSRPWRIATAAFLTLLALIAALGNQRVSNAVVDRGGQSFFDNAVRSLLTYQWRFAPAKHDIGRAWAGSLALVVSALVLTFFLVAIVTRARGGFWQTFIATWMVVLTATLLATYVRALVVKERDLTGLRTPKANSIFFSQLSPNAYQVAVGLGFGFVVGLVAAIVAVLTRRKTDVVRAPDGQSFPPPLAYPAPVGYDPNAQAQQPRAAQPVAPSMDKDRDGTDDRVQRTTVIPVVDDRRGDDSNRTDSDQNDSDQNDSDSDETRAHRVTETPVSESGDASPRGGSAPLPGQATGATALGADETRAMPRAEDDDDFRRGGGPQR